MSGGPRNVFVTRQNAQSGITSQKLALDGDSSEKKIGPRMKRTTYRREKNEDETNEVEVTKTED